MPYQRLLSLPGTGIALVLSTPSHSTLSWAGHSLPATQVVSRVVRQPMQVNQRINLLFGDDL